MIFINQSLYSQSRQDSTSSLISEIYSFSQDTLILIDRTVVPGSIEIINLSSDQPISFEMIDQGIAIKSHSSRDSINLRYRQLPYNLGTSQSLMDPEDITKKSSIIKIANDYTKDESFDRRFIQSNKLEYTGSFTRGINFGNSQDLVLMSDFNLQMTGDLGNGLLIRAAISDDNIPIQPEGNTQVLQEFDKVFIEVQKDRTTVIAGDYELASPDGYFMKYYKKLQGISVSNFSSSKKGWTANNKGSFAISRGKFNRIQLAITEGNQGPYRLEGDPGEVFLQVLSGTEKVFADGRLLKRGENFDYVIDYNRAELRFTPNMIITENTRIIVEYEFASQNYLRSLYATESSFTKGNLTAYLNLYNEQDSKNLTGNIQLDSTDIRIFEESGDQPAQRSGLFLPEGNDFTGLIPYRVQNGILIHAPGETENVVSARFSFVGEGNGDYVIDTENGTNGRVYRYEPGGPFSTNVQLVAPERRQLTTAGINYDIGDSTSVNIEAALSQFDLNRFSSIDNEDNLGLAVLAKVTDTRLLGGAKTDSITATLPWSLTSSSQIELRQKSYNPLNPYRPTEFVRDWNLTRLTTTNDQILHSTGFSLSKGISEIGYAFSGFHNRDIYDGLKHTIIGRHRIGRLFIDGTSTFLNSNSDFLNEKTAFLRPKATVEYALSPNWSVGTYYEKERNIAEALDSDTLDVNSFNYDLIKGYVSSAANKPFNINASITRRIDDKILGQDRTALTRTSVSNDYALGGAWKSSQTSDLKWNITYRDFKDVDNLDNDRSKQTLLGTVEHRLNLYNKGITLTTYYESNSGQEPKVEFQFIEVQRGEGSYVWIDSNMDSIPQIFEFEIATFIDQANYERISIFNNEFINSNNSILNQSLRIIPKKFIKNKQSIWNKFQWSTRYRLDQRSETDSLGGLFTPIILDIDNPRLIAFNTAIDNDLFFNRGQTDYDIQLSYRTIGNQTAQVTDNIRRTNQEFFTRSRINIVKSIDFILQTGLGSRDHRSNFTIQDFDIEFWRVVPQINYRPSTNLRLITSYRIERNTNILDALAVEAGTHQRSLQQDLSLELTWRKSSTSNLQVSTNLVFIKMDGANNPAVTFEMLQGLTPGTNILIQSNYTRRVGKNFDLIFNYSARRSEGNRTVHNAGAQLRAIF